MRDVLRCKRAIMIYSIYLRVLLEHKEHSFSRVLKKFGPDGVIHSFLADLPPVQINTNPRI